MAKKKQFEHTTIAINGKVLGTVQSITGFASAPEAICRPAQCPACKSSRRAPFRDGPVNEQWITIDVAGQVYNHVIWRNTSCLDCGQRYRVLEYRHDPRPENAR